MMYAIEGTCEHGVANRETTAGCNRGHIGLGWQGYALRPGLWMFWLP
jgi:hypothetical protein